MIENNFDWAYCLLVLRFRLPCVAVLCCAPRRMLELEPGSSFSTAALATLRQKLLEMPELVLRLVPWWKASLKASWETESAQPAQKFAVLFWDGRRYKWHHYGGIWDDLRMNFSCSVLDDLPHDGEPSWYCRWATLCGFFCAHEFARGIWHRTIKSTYTRLMNW